MILASIGKSILSRTIVPLATILSVSACTIHPDRHAFLPNDRQQMAQIEGFENVRAWADIPTNVTKSEAMSAINVSRNVHLERGTVAILAISGGGAGGAWAAGVLNGWSARADRPEFMIVTGVSTGALIAPFAFLGSAYDAQLKESYTTVSDEDIADTLGLFQALDVGYAASAEPLRKQLERTVTPKLINQIADEDAKGRRLWIGTTDLDARRPVLWDMGQIASRRNEEARQLFINVMLASAAIPGFFPPIIFDSEFDGVAYDEMHVDGGTTVNVIGWPDIAVGEILDLDPEIAALPRSYHVIVNQQLTGKPKAVDYGLLSVASASIWAQNIWNTRGALQRLYIQAQENGFEFYLSSLPRDFNVEAESWFDTNYMNALFEQGEQVGNAGSWLRTPPGSQIRPLMQDTDINQSSNNRLKISKATPASTPAGG